MYRTPERFSNLPGFDYEPRHRAWDGMRLTHVDEDEGAAVVMLHGEPTRSYLYRKVMGPVIEAGHLWVVFDLPGFGRSDKPIDDGWYSYDNHTRVILRCSRSSTCATSRSWSRIGAARSGCA